MGNRENKKRYIAGLLIIIFVNASAGLLILSPYIPNYIGQIADDIFLNGIDARINATRMGPIKLTIKKSDGTPLSSTKVEFNQTRHEFLFGCHLFSFDKTSNISGCPEADELYKKYFKNLFNFAILPFYWRAYEPMEGTYPTETWLDTAIAWCESNNITTKGHPLSWRNPAGYPTWLPDNDTLVKQKLESRIEYVVNKYKDKIQIWDVVNEPTHLPPFGYPSVANYVNTCFSIVDEIDTDVYLTLNEYGIIGHDFGFGPFYNLVTNLLQNNAPIDYIGLQGREPRTDWIPATEIWASLEAYSQLGLPIHVTELTWPSYPIPITNSWMKGLWNEERQAEYAVRYYKTCFSHPNVEGIVWWGLWDGVGWVQNGNLIDDNFEPKEVYTRLNNLINHEWHTEGEITTNDNGEIEFSGFYGIYDINIPTYGFNFEIDAKKGQTNEFSIIII